MLVIHGGGGGYDQGELIAQTVLDARFHRIIPSRFGYLGSSLPDGATWGQQAHAYARLLDHLNIDTVAVVAMSQGGPSALLFAVLHPERVFSLTCLSCGVASSTTAEQEAANLKGKMLKLIFRYDLIYWTVSTLFRSQFMGILGVSREVTENLTSQQHEAGNRFIDEMNPVSPRSAGATFDNEATMPWIRITSTSTPTLIIHARDDTLQLHHNAEFASATIPGARLVDFDRGGHVVMIVEQEITQSLVQEHILANTGP
ncbi:MAG: alpha/beta hydrolase [Gammaproteobacteria bacterium]